MKDEKWRLSYGYWIELSNDIEYLKKRLTQLRRENDDAAGFIFLNKVLK